MAVTIVSIPEEYNMLNTEIAIVVSMTGVSSPTETRVFSYHLADMDDNKVTPELSYSPEEGVQFKLTFQSDIFSVLYTEKPSNGAHAFGYIREEEEMLGEYKLKYKEIVFNKTTCIQTIAGEAESGSFKVINASPVYFDDSAISQSMTILSHKPRIKEVCISDNDLMYVFASGSVEFGYSAYNYKGALVSSAAGTTQSLGGKVGSFNLMPRDLPRTAVYIDVFMRNGVENSYVYTLKLVDCCDRVQITFQDYHGGLNTVSGILKLPKSQINQNEIDVLLNNEVNTELSGANKETYMEYSVLIDAHLIKNYDKYFYQQFIASGKYYLKIVDGTSSYKEFKVLGNNFAWDEVSARITANFKVNKSIKQPNYYN